MLDQTTFRQDEAVSLAHALSAYVASANSLRALSIKGFTLEMYGLRSKRVHADADVWVHPDDFDDFVETMHLYGWEARFQRFTPRLIPNHSITLAHQNWPCDIDVHWFFPGCFAPADKVFDVFWRHTRKVSVNQVSHTVPDKTAAALIGLLHSARHPFDPSKQREANQICNEIMMDSAVRPELVQGLAAEVGATVAIQQFLGKMGINIAEEQLAEAVDLRRTWDAHTDMLESGTTAVWLRLIQQAPFRQKWRLIVKAAFPTHAEIETLKGRRVSRREARGYRRERFAVALKRLPHTVWNLLRYRGVSLKSTEVTHQTLGDNMLHRGTRR